jgi:hypothetical protein
MSKAAREIKFGKVNDVKMYATQDKYGYLSKVNACDIGNYYPEQLFLIYYDSGAYPGVENVESHICYEVTKEYKLATHKNSPLPRSKHPGTITAQGLS